MPFAGKQLMPRTVAEEIAKHWTSDSNRLKMLATGLAESKLSLGAWHDNFAADGVTETSRDCGWAQINIPANEIGTPIEDALRTTSTDPAVYLPVLAQGAVSARALFDEPWTLDRGPGTQAKRLFQAWVAYTTGWATFPHWWVWHQDIDGNPIGPWIATGRYLQQAIVGQANYHLVIKQDKTFDEALAYARGLAATWHVGGTLGERSNVVAWIVVPPKPLVPPADGIGPRPIPNTGA